MRNLSELNDQVRQAEQSVIDAETNFQAVSAISAEADEAFEKANRAKRKVDAWAGTVALASIYDAKAAAKVEADANMQAAAQSIEDTKASVDAAGRAYDAMREEIEDMDFIYASAIYRAVTYGGEASPEAIASEITAGKNSDLASRKARFGGKEIPLTRYDAAGDQWLEFLKTNGPIVSLFWSQGKFGFTGAGKQALEKAISERSVERLSGEAYDQRIERDYQEAVQYEEDR